MPLLTCHYTHLIYVTEQIWLPHWKYDLHSGKMCEMGYGTDIFSHYQNTTNSNSYFTQYCQICAVNKYSPQIPHLCHYQSYFLCRYQTTLSVHAHNINSPWSKTSPQTMIYIHFTIFANVPEQICLPHHRSMPHSPNHLVYMEIQIIAHTSQRKKNKKTQLLFTML